MNDENKVVPQIQQETSLEAPQRPVVLPTDFVGSLKKGNATPSVRNLVRARAGGVPVTITDFKEGQIGQSIKILGDGVTDVANNSKIVRASSGVLSLDHVHTFTYFEDRKWHEDAASTGTGTPGPQGDPGPQGIPGPQGPIGLTGPPGFMPTYIAPGETFTIPAFRQGLWAVPIVIDGVLIIDGVLVPVD